jgi:hypothetical protein
VNAETFNALYEVGIPVFAYPGARPEDDANDERLVTRTRSRASVLGGHTDVVWVEDHSACIALSHIDVVTEDEWEAAKVDAAEAAQGALPMPVGPEALDDTRLAEIRSLLRYETSISFHSARAKQSMLLLLAEVERLNSELAGARTAALNEAADWFEQRAATEPDQSYRARVMRGAANDVRRLATEAAAS